MLGGSLKYFSIRFETPRKMLHPTNMLNINEIERIVKTNSLNSLNIVSDFIVNY